MKNFRGRIIRVDDNDYVVEDSDTDSEVGAVYDDDDLQVLFTPGLGIPLGLALYTDSESGSEGEEELLSLPESGPDSNTDDSANLSFDDLFIPVSEIRQRQIQHQSVVYSENEAEDVSLEGYFAFGGERRRTASGRIGSGEGLSSRSPGGSGALGGSRLTEVAGSRGDTSGGAGGADIARTSRARSSSLSLTPAAIESLGRGEVGLEQILRRAIAMNEASVISRIAAEEEDDRRAGEIEAGSSHAMTPSTSAVKVDQVDEQENCGIGGDNDENMTETNFADGVDAQKEVSSSDKEDKEHGPSTTTTTSFGDNAPSGPCSESGESGRTPETEREADADVTCNPMVSDVEELEENYDTLQGDRIGSTTYSERHVLKILMKWVQELPKYSDGTVNEDAALPTNGNGKPAADVDRNRFLEPDFEEEMSLLWDMSYEPDVMNFLVQHNVFNLIRDSLHVSCCDRLTEIGLGIMANIISQQSIVEDFSIHDASLKLVEGVVCLAQKMPRVPVLIQVFAVMRRITWFLGNVALVQGWMGLLLSQDFLNCANFILSSSTNALLLGNVIVSLFSILESLSPDHTDKEDDEENCKRDEEQEEPESTTSYFGKVLEQKKKDFENYGSFCQTEFVPSLCEGLNELLKNPKPRKVQKMTSTHENNRLPLGDDATDERTLEDLEPPIPDGHVQMAVLNGLSCFFYLYKTPNGKQAIRDNHKPVVAFLLNLFRKFGLCTDSTTRSSTLDYFSLGMNLLAFCHKQEEALSQDGMKVPLVTASQLMTDEEEDEELRTLLQKDGISHTSQTFIALVLHEYYASLADNFGQEEITKFKSELITFSEEHPSSSSGRKYKKFLEVVDNLVAQVAAEQQSSCSSSALNNLV